MAATSSGRKSRPSRFVKGGTESTRKHRFQSFNQRISKIKVDPVHRKRSNNLDEDRIASYFQIALQRWRDLNLSEDFTDFVKEVATLSESLPQLLHYQQEIFSALTRHIEQRNVLSLEALLDLLANFAHDLGSRFEAYLPNALRLIASLAAHHADVEVIEWSFECLAWLFKYLSRLLVPDLRPIFHIMAPLLGKELQKAHVTRFAAEALSFLIRKAASLYAKNPVPLVKIIQHVVEDLSSLEAADKSYELYRQGLMTLFVESMKGVERRLHSSGVRVYDCLLNCILNTTSERSSKCADVAYGTTVGIIHHTDADGFRPILETILDHISKLTLGSKDTDIGTCGHLLFVAVSVRKGSRIADWTQINDAVTSLLSLCDVSSLNTITSVYQAAAVAFSSCPLEVMIPKTRAAMGIITQKYLSMHFLAFCNNICSLDRSRFDTLILPYLDNWILNHWQEQELQLYLAIPEILGGGEKKALCPELLQRHIVAKFRDLRKRNDLVAHCSAFLVAMAFLNVNFKTKEAIMSELSLLIKESLLSPANNDTRTLFSLGIGLRAYAQLQAAGGKMSKVWPAVYEAAAHFGTLPSYLEAVLLSLNVANVADETNRFDKLIQVTTENLHSPSHILRRLSLQILDALNKYVYHQHADIIDTALQIEDNPLTLESARLASLHARKLSIQYKAIISDTWLLKIIPHFCFGLLTFKLSQLCDEAVEVLKSISNARSGEEAIWSLAVQWLECKVSPEERLDSGIIGQAPNGRRALSGFECSNLLQVQDMMNLHAAQMRDASGSITAQFSLSSNMATQIPADAPSLALKVLLGIPHIAEKRSRQFVPIFLRWAAEDSVDSPTIVDSITNERSDFDDPSEPSRLVRKDRKAMLDLFGQFVNPKVLFRASEVYEALLGLLASGDNAVQKSAFQAILTWKSPSLVAYQENLSNLLDDVRLREEIAVFINVDRSDSQIQNDHRQELMPVLLRLLYGKVIARSGPTGRRGQSIKRKAVLETLAQFEDSDLEEFVNIALGPLTKVAVINSDCRLVAHVISQEYLDTRKQLGLVNMIKALLQTIGDRLAPLASRLMDTLLYCSIKSSRILNSVNRDILQDDQKNYQTSMLRDIRQTGLQSLDLMFQHWVTKQFAMYLPVVFDELINPRMERLPVETSQSVSGLLQLFSTWASSKRTVNIFSDYNPAILKSVVACLGVDSAKDDVKLYVLNNILIRMIDTYNIPEDTEKIGYEGDDNAARLVLRPHTDYILEVVGKILHKSPGRDILESSIHLIAVLAPLVEGSAEARNLLEISSFLLDQPSNRVKPKSKGDLLKVVKHFLPLLDSQMFENLEPRIFETISSLFGFFRDRPNRELLSEVLAVLGKQDEELAAVTSLCKKLNAFSAQKVDEPDYDVRLSAFRAINDTQYLQFSLKQWRPVLYNMLYHIKDPEEQAIRFNASFALRRFVEVHGDIEASDNAASDMLKRILLPALRIGILNHSELVRAEYLNVMAHLVRHNPHWDEVSDMSILLCGDDEEASFFSNILHIQQHRRLRALRRLATEARKTTLRSANVTHFFVPLIEHFIFDKVDDETAHNLSAEAITTLGTLGQSLEWPQFRAMFRRFTSYIHSKANQEKTVIKLLGLLVDALNDASTVRKTQLCQSQSSNIISSELQNDIQRPSALAVTIPRQEKLTDDLIKNIIPSLTTYLHDKDESTVSLRVPVAVSIVKLLQLLPTIILKEQLPPVLTDVCNILRSRAQESRDLTRKTLVQISTIIGPSCFGFVLGELRGSLSRGYQLHVLSFTVHAILVATSEIFKPGELDYCLPQIMSVIVDDIFGAIGQEKDADEYISKMKEVKSSKSYDSMELLARITSVDSFAQLIGPIQILLHERLDLKRIKKIDELLRRLGIGMLRNEEVNDRRLLVFCHEIIRETYKTGGEPRESKEDHRSTRFLIELNAANKHSNRSSTSPCNYKLTRFSLDLLRSVLHKYETLQTPSNIHGFIPIIGDSIVQQNEEVQVSALRLLTTIIKIPLDEIDDNAGLYISECVRIVKGSTTMSSELAQAALKLVSSMLRERKRIGIRENDLAYLLKKLLPDLEEPDRQGVTFNFLKAILIRKVVIPEVYEVLDAVAAMMVTNQTKGTRDVARSIYFQFIQDYPQAKTRFSKQMVFLTESLNYKYQEGRQSILEAIHLFVSKIGGDLVQDILLIFFMPLIKVMINDESAACREMAGMLVKSILDKADGERRQSFLSTLRSWLDQSENPLLTRVSLQIYCSYLDSADAQDERELSFLQPRLLNIFKNSVKHGAESHWELLYFALQLFLKICQVYPAVAFSVANAPVWVSIRHCLAFPHIWIKHSSARIIGTLFADFARTNAGNDSLELPLNGSGGLHIPKEELLEITRFSLTFFRSTDVNEELASQSVRNLVFLGRHLGTIALDNRNETSEVQLVKKDDESDEGDEGALDLTSRKTAVQYIFERASAVIRRGPATTRAAALTPMKAALQLVGALCNHLPISVIASSIQTILLALHNLTDPSIPAPFSSDETFTSSYKALVANSTEIMNLLQKKLGTTEYIANLAKVRGSVKGRREDRRIKRRIEAVAQPEKAGVTKKRKGEKKREKRKERSGEERGRRRGW